MIAEHQPAAFCRYRKESVACDGHILFRHLAERDSGNIRLEPTGNTCRTVAEVTRAYANLPSLSLGDLVKNMASTKREDAVPLMSMYEGKAENEYEEDELEDVHFTNNNRDVKSMKAKLYLTGGRREWKFTGGRVQNRLSVAALVIFATAILLVFIFVVYPLLRRPPVDDNGKPFKHVYPWATTYCKHGMTRLIEMCPCIANINLTFYSIDDASTLLVDCIYNCTDEEVDPDEYIDDDDADESDETAEGDNESENTVDDAKKKTGNEDKGNKDKGNKKTKEPKVVKVGKKSR